MRFLNPDTCVENSREFKFEVDDQYHWKLDRDLTTLVLPWPTRPEARAFSGTARR
jgi:hypothetical protein